jgi:hypothetical protein
MDGEGQRRTVSGRITKKAINDRAALGGWANFYVIAGAMIGLQVVVMTLIAGRPVDRLASVSFV